MSEKIIHFLSSILSPLGSSCVCSIITKLIEFQHGYTKIKWSLCTQIEISTQNQSSIDTKHSDTETSTSEYCNSCGILISSEGGRIIDTHKRGLSAEDVEMVVKNLELGSFSEEAGLRKCRDCLVVDGVLNLLEEKKATMEELKEAFSVFDKNGDGFIDAGELQLVMSRLEMNEGSEMEECLKMIGAFDGNGDGRIDFGEFKSMLENLV